MNINIGELNKKIRFINYTVALDEEDILTRQENTFHECWAKVSNTSGTEIIKSGSDFSNVKTRFLIRYTPKNITGNLDIMYNGKKYNVEYVNNYNESNEFIEIFATLKEPISYVLFTPATLSWIMFEDGIYQTKELKLLVSEESTTRDSFFTSYQQGMKQTYIYKVNQSDWIQTKHLDPNTNSALFATSIIVEEVNYSIVRTYKEKDSNVLELICEAV